MEGISVIIPTLNRGNILLDTISSLLSQDFVYPYEIVIIDQSENVNQLVAELSVKHDIIYYYHVTFFRGLPEARNYGVQHAQFNYILFLDDDIECENNLLSEHYKYLKKAEVGVVAGGITEKFKKNSGSRSIGKFHFLTATPERGFHIRKNGYVDHGGGGNYSIRKDVFYETGGVDEFLNYGAALYEETEICLRVKQLGYKVYFNFDAHVWHLAANSGGCRVTDITRYVSSLVHNRAILISRHLKWYYKITASLYLLRLVISYAYSYRKIGLLRIFVKSYSAGYKKGKLKPKYTVYEK